MKCKAFCILLSGVIALTALSACGRTEPALTEHATAAQTEALTETAETTASADPATVFVPDDTAYAGDETRTLAYYTGIYGVGRCTVHIDALDETTAKISITWGSSAWEMSEWEMTGFFDPDTYRLTYADCVKTDVQFADDGSETRTVVYENGVGRFQLSPDHSMMWQDEQENAGEDMQFAYSPVP